MELDGCFSVYSPTTQAVHMLSASASSVWSLLDGTRTVSEVVTRLADEYGTEPMRLQAEVEQVVAALARSGLLESP